MPAGCHPKESNSHFAFQINPSFFANWAPKNSAHLVRSRQADRLLIVEFHMSFHRWQDYPRSTLFDRHIPFLACIYQQLHHQKKKFEVPKSKLCCFLQPPRPWTQIHLTGPPRMHLLLHGVACHCTYTYIMSNWL